MPSRTDPLATARTFVAEHFPDALAAFLGGSVVRGDATATSDLDIAIITERPDAPFRVSLVYRGWPVEAFVHTPRSVREFFEAECRRRRPTLKVICTEGPILVDRDHVATELRAEAAALLAAGPEPMTAEQILDSRYRLSDLLDDFEGSTRPEETFLLAAEVAGETSALLLGFHCAWGGVGKWIPRALQRFDPTQAERLAAALHAFQHSGDRAPLVQFASATLTLVGGRLFAGYWANPAGERRVFGVGEL